jgi:hypothetical protein
LPPRRQNIGRWANTLPSGAGAVHNPAPPGCKRRNSRPVSFGLLSSHFCAPGVPTGSPRESPRGIPNRNPDQIRANPHPQSVALLPALRCVRHPGRVATGALCPAGEAATDWPTLPAEKAARRKMGCSSCSPRAAPTDPMGSARHPREFHPPLLRRFSVFFAMERPGLFLPTITLHPVP